MAQSGSWYFVSLPTTASAEVRAATDGTRRGFGSVRVRATVGGTSWDTSIFPDSKNGSYVLPVKKAVRLAEGLEEGEPVDMLLRVL